MIRGAAVSLVATLLLSACGSSSDEAAPASPRSSSSSSGATPGSGGVTSEAVDETYFTDAESDALNVPARTSQAAAARAVLPANQRRCNRARDRGFGPWRACWHGLLDPYSKDLLAVGAAFELLSSGAFGDRCVSELKKSNQVFVGLSRRVDRVLAGIDSSRYSAQVKAINSYNQTVDGVEAAYAKPFRATTRVCYSPAVLEKLDSSASASPKP